MNWRGWAGLLGAASVLAAVALVAHFYRPLQSVTGFVSRTLCSGVFVSGLNANQVYAQTIQPFFAGDAHLEGLIRFQVDPERRDVTTSLGKFFERRAAFDQNLGCLLESIAGPVANRAARSQDVRRKAAPPLLPEIAGAAVVEPVQGPLRQALDRAFVEVEKPPFRQTAAVVVVHKGRLVAERYAPGYGIDSALLGYSVSKSVLSTLVGILVRQGRLSVTSPAPVAQWNSAGDPRHAITIDMLLRMTSGLDIPETNKGYDAVARMLLIERDMARFAEGAELVTEPGKVWRYTSGNSLILSRIVRDALGGRAEEVLDFARRELFEPLGMQTVTLEFDSVDTPIGSTYVYASARDWARFGMLYLDDGVVNGRRILPEGWVRYSASQTLDSPYAAGFWRGSKTLRARWAMPEDAFFASGFLGQRVMVIPSERLVIARFGNSHGASYDLEGFMTLVADVRRTLTAPNR